MFANTQLQGRDIPPVTKTEAVEKPKTDDPQNTVGNAAIAADVAKNGGGAAPMPSPVLGQVAGAKKKKKK